MSGIHYLVPGGGLSSDGRRWVPAKKFLLHHQALGDRCRTLFKSALQGRHPELFAQVPAIVWKRHWNVGCQAAGSGENALRYLSRYVFKTATSNRILTQLPEGKLRWDYRHSKTGRFTSLKLDPLEFMGRFLQHILPRSFARVRTFGWLHPAAKIPANRVRALLGHAPLLSLAEQQAWNPPSEPVPELPGDNTPASPKALCSAPLCPRCRQAMRLVGSWHPGQMVLYPKRPP